MFHGAAVSVSVASFYRVISAVGLCQFIDPVALARLSYSLIPDNLLQIYHVVALSTSSAVVVRSFFGLG